MDNPENPTPQPPRWADRLLEWFVAPHLLEDLQGDLYEVYRKRLEQVGSAQAGREYGRAVLHYLSPFFYKRKPTEYPQLSTLHPDMIRNYLLVAWRNLIRSKSFSAINILGLSIGMTCCMLLLLYIRSELSFDKHHRNASDLFLVKSDVIYPTGAQEENPRQSSPYAAALKAEFPEIEQVTRLKTNFSESKVLLQVHEDNQRLQSFYETNGYQADSTFFDLFTYQFTEGDPKTALNDVHSVVLSEEVAHKLFGEKPALNRIIKINGQTGNGENFQVTGVYRDESTRSHIDARFLVPMTAGWVGSFLREQPQNFYYNNMFHTYLRLRPGSDAQQLNRKLPAFIEKYAREGLKGSGFDKKISLLPVSDLHLYGQMREIITPTSSMTYLYILASIAIFTLLIACINFMNLATARSAKRAAEVGIRKVMGAGRGLLVRQFLGESMFLSAIGLVIAFGLVAVLLPVFNQLTDKQLNFRELIEPEIIGSFVALTLLTGLLAGSYPAFYLSVFNPVQVLKGRFANSISAIALRRGLVVFQFVISIGLVFATLVIQQQMRFLQNQPLGFTKEQQLVIPLRSEAAHKAYAGLQNEIRQNNQVTGASGTKYYPGIRSPSDVGLYRPDQNVGQAQYVKTNFVGPDFMKLMGFQLLKGRIFSTEFPGDTNLRMVVNETVLRKMGVPLEKAVGYKLKFGDKGDASLEIVGVVKDFHFEDLHQPIQPYAFLLLNDANSYNYLVVHVNTAQVDNVLAFAEQKWKALVPDEPFEYSFIDEDFQRNYQTDARTSAIVGYFTGIAILISCLGLFGLAAFAAQQRTKEIGVRKVLGASVGSIVGLLSKDFIKLIVIALVIASPLAGYAMNRWLQGFAYKIAIEWWMFALAALLIVAIALLTVSFQSIKAALLNPVKSLRSE
ncbi:ABC transporter permease [Larkinella terrae]|nr:ABC transporter permease [Larkinella terrae]